MLPAHRHERCACYGADRTCPSQAGCAHQPLPPVRAGGRRLAARRTGNAPGPLLPQRHGAGPAETGKAPVPPAAPGHSHGARCALPRSAPGAGSPAQPSTGLRSRALRPHRMAVPSLATGWLCPVGPQPGRQLWAQSCAARRDRHYKTGTRLLKKIAVTP